MYAQHEGLKKRVEVRTCSLQKKKIMIFQLITLLCKSNVMQMSCTYLEC